MDVKLHVTILRLHSEYLTRLFTEVSTHLGTLEQTLSEGSALTSTETGGLLDKVASVQSRLCTEGELFCHRLQVFLEGSQTSHEAPEKLGPKSAPKVVHVRHSAGVVR
jgi:hypothetical protein